MKIYGEAVDVTSQFWTHPSYLCHLCALAPAGAATPVSEKKEKEEGESQQRKKKEGQGESARN